MKIAIKLSGLLCILLSGLQARAQDQVSFPLVVQNHSQLEGQKVNSLIAFSFDATKKRWNQIPFQIDERNSRNEYILDEGEPYTKNTDDGALDSNDELSFFSANLGLCAADQYLANLPVKYRHAWKLGVQLEKVGVGCIFVVSVYAREKGSIDFSPPVSYDAEALTVQTQSYEYSFSRGRAALLGRLALKEKEGWKEILKSSRFSLIAMLPWYLPNFQLTDRNFISNIESWKTGPVRTIIAVGVKLKNFLSVFNLHMFSELVFYSQSLHIPTVLEFSFDPGRFFLPGSGIVYEIDFSEGLLQTLESNFIELPNQSANELKSKINAPRVDMIGDLIAKVALSEQDFLMRVKVDQRLAKNSLPPIHIKREDRSNKEKIQSWPWLKDLSSDFGVFVDLSGLEQGSFDFGLDLFLISKAHEGIIADFEKYSFVWSAVIPH